MSLVSLLQRRRIRQLLSCFSGEEGLRCLFEVMSLETLFACHELVCWHWLVDL
jgi:hypothetical protein